MFEKVSIILTFLLPVILIGIPVAIIKLMRKTNTSKTENLFKGIDLKSEEARGDVLIEFTTYDGFVFWVTSRNYAGYLPPAQARELLKRMYKYNLKYGLLNFFGMFTFLFSTISYRTQIQSVEEQESSLRAAKKRRRRKQPRSRDNQ